MIDPRNRSAAEYLAAWRTTLVERMARWTAALSVPPLTWVAFDGLRAHEPHLAWLVAGMIGSSAGCALLPVSTRARAFWLVIHYVVMIGLGTIFLGLTAGVGGLVTLIPLLSVLTIGKREAVALFLTEVAILTIWLTLVLAGLLPRPAPELSDAGLPFAAARLIMASSAVGLATLLASSYLIEKLTTTLFEAERLLLSERAEARRREEAERALFRAQGLEVIGRLAGGLAHDVNNNLTVALTYAELIERRATADPMIGEMCATIKEACSNASKLGQQLLSVGRGDALAPQRVSLQGATQHLERLLRATVGKGVHLRVEIPQDLPEVYVDPVQLERVLLNLAINGRDAMPRGGDLTISADQRPHSFKYHRSTSPDGPVNAVRLRVTDQGTGIEDSALPRILEPFFTTKGIERGTGLGLYAAHAFAEASGGRLCIETELGRGSTFTLELPPAPPALSGDRCTLEQGPARPAVDGTTVLVVDDDPSVRKSIGAELRATGYRVIEAEDSVAALASAEQADRIDLLCTDSVMPSVGGPELIQRFRRRHPQTRILVCSAYIQDPCLRELVMAGKCTALAKPFTPTQLRAAVTCTLAGPALHAVDLERAPPASSQC